MHVVVIGAGVVGCATAYELAWQGHAVTLVDSHPEPARGASRANGAQLSYSYVEPLASPATLRALPGLLLDRSSPLRFRPRLDAAQWRWSLAFLRSCNASRAARGTQALLELAAASRDVLEHWITDQGLEIGLQRNGKLVLCPDAATLERQRRQVELQARFGASQIVLDRAGCIAREGALAGYDGFVGGVWTPGECAADPVRFCRSLVQGLLARGGRLELGEAVQAIVVRQGRAVAVRTGVTTIGADAVVVAAGLASRGLLAPLGETLPLYPVKGYSLTLAIRDASRAPKTNVTDLARKTVFAPLGDRLRVAAMAELVGQDLRLPADRIATIRDSVERVFPGACSFDELNAWAGLRPATPDSVPILRPCRVANVLVNAGHGALGFTLAAGSARAMARMVGQLKGPGRHCSAQSATA